MNEYALSHRLAHMRFVILLVEHDASQCLIDPVWPLMETLVRQLALVKELVSVDCHDRF